MIQFFAVCGRQLKVGIKVEKKQLLRPNWLKISESMPASLTEDEKHLFWEEQCGRWILDLKEILVGEYRIFSTQNFLILSDENDRYLKLFSDFIESKLKHILNMLPGIASNDGYGKNVVLIFRDVDQYYEYIDLYYPEEGEFAPNAGIYINEGYGHFAFPVQDLYIAEPIAVHELTHACLTHLPLPLWLDEGIAVAVEDSLCSGVNQTYTSPRNIIRHKAFWDEAALKRFWSGESFHELGDGQSLSYALAYILIRNLSQEYDRFRAFVVDADHNDAGQASLKKHFGISLNELVEIFIGLPS